jgi:hypothetical protein
MIKSRRMRLAGHVAHVGVIRNAYIILVVEPEGKSYSVDLSTDGKITLKWILWK